MQVFSVLLTFAASPQVLSVMDANGNSILAATRIYAEPASTNTHDCFVEKAGVVTGATGNTLGVIKVLAKPPAAVGSGTVLDFWEVTDQKGGNLVHPAQYQFDGFLGEKIRVTIHTA